MLEQARIELYVEMRFSRRIYMPIKFGSFRLQRECCSGVLDRLCTRFGGSIHGIGTRHAQHRSRRLLPSDAFINEYLGYAHPCMSTGALLYRGKDGPQTGN